jgi:hypothetical protein
LDEIQQPKGSNSMDPLAQAKAQPATKSGTPTGRRSAGAGACTGARATCTDNAGAHGASERRGADRAVFTFRRRTARTRGVLITKHIATHVPALIGSRSRSELVPVPSAFAIPATAVNTAR